MNIKKILLFLNIIFCLVVGYGQNCIDAIILNLNGNGYDTLYCKILSEDETGYIIDNGNAITSLSHRVVTNKIMCIREMTPLEIYKFKGLDDVTFDLFSNSNTAGAHLRKAAFSAYMSVGIGLASITITTLSAFVFENNSLKTASYVTGGILAATSVFFMVRGWNQIYKAGKLLDINENTSLYLIPTQDGLTLSIQF